MVHCYIKLQYPIISKAVNDVIDLWLTIMYDGLGEDQYRKWGFPVKQGVRGIEKISFLPVENL